MSGKERVLRIGKIPYANLFPIYYYLERKCSHSSSARISNYKFIEGVPSRLNKMLRDGRLDVSPSSSIEYLRHKEKYSVIPWLSISSAGPAYSIFLFSSLPLDKLGGKRIAVSSQSETSRVLLKIILKNFYSLKCRFVVVRSGSIKKLLGSFPACLLIGDDALKAYKKVKSSGLRVRSENQTKNSELIYTYDLGELWFRHTGLPFIFALWIVRKKAISEKRELVKRLLDDLIRAKKYVSQNLSLIARHAPQRKWLGETELIDYWEGISYDFTESHLEGLLLFERYAKKLKI